MELFIVLLAILGGHIVSWYYILKELRHWRTVLNISPKNEDLDEAIKRKEKGH